MDMLLPEEDPENYLDKLRVMYAELKGEEPAEVESHLINNAAELSSKADKLPDDGYKSDESFSEDFYLNMHEDIIHRKPKAPPAQEENLLVVESPDMDEADYKKNRALLAAK